MNLKLIRKDFTNNSTIGELFVDGVFECYVLEDVVRLPHIKVAGETAIPYGTYPVIIDFSNRFQKLMPLLLNVPNFAGVRIHKGNTKADTDGCLLLGTTKGKDIVGGSKIAYDAFFKKLTAAYKKEKVTIEIVES